LKAAPPSGGHIVVTSLDKLMLLVAFAAVARDKMGTSDFELVYHKNIEYPLSGQAIENAQQSQKPYG
jgi:hypothetical protein